MRTPIPLLSIILCSTPSFAADGAAQIAVVTAKPMFELRGDILYLTLSPSNRNYDIAWKMTTPDVRFVPVSLDTNRVYTFTVAQRPF